MPRIKKVVEEMIEEKVEETIEPVAEVKEVVEQTFQVFDSKGDFVRDYKTSTSGENAEELAKVFAKELNGNVK